MTEFPNTRLSVIEKIRTGNDEDRKAALHSFIDSYRPALMSFLVGGLRISENDAEDCVHDFLINKVMNGKILDLANGKGRFRNLLRVSIKRYLIDSLRKKNNQRIVDGLALEETAGEQDSNSDPFDRVWATAVFGSALAMLKANSPYWNLFQDRVLTQPPIPYEEVIKKHQYESPEKASNCLTTAKRHFNRYVDLCLKEQSNWTDGGEAESLNDDFELLKEMLGQPDLIQSAIASIDLEAKSVTISANGQHSLHGDQLILLEESSDALWEDSEIPEIIEHLLRQPIGTFVETTHTSTPLSDWLFGNEKPEDALGELGRLKEYFNRRGKSEKSDLPEKVNVMMTFAAVAAFLTQGGEPADITSMRTDFLARRIEQLNEKPWVPGTLKRLFHDAVEQLLG